MNIYEDSLQGLELSDCLILDCAIGAGEATYYWAAEIQRQGGSSVIHGLDLSFSAADRQVIAENLQEFQSLVKLVEGDVRTLANYADSSVDYVLCDDTLVFLAAAIDGVQQALQSFYRVLKPGGRLVLQSEIPIENANFPYEHNQLRRWNFAKAVYALKGEVWSVEPTLVEVEDLVNQAGFTIEQKKLYPVSKQKDPSATIAEWIELMQSEIPALPVSEALKQSLLNETAEIAEAVKKEGMACPGFFTLRCRK